MEGHVRKRNGKWYYSFELSSHDGKRRRIERVGGRTKKEANDALLAALSEYKTSGQVFIESDIPFGFIFRVKKLYGSLI